MTGAVSDENIFDPIKEEGAMQDPCTGDNINLTIQKLWIDNNNEDSRRPSTLTITLKRYITDDNQKIYDDTFNGEVTITSDNADYDTNSWSITNPYPLFDRRLLNIRQLHFQLLHMYIYFHLHQIMDMD